MKNFFHIPRAEVIKVFETEVFTDRRGRSTRKQLIQISFYNGRYDFQCMLWLFDLDTDRFCKGDHIAGTLANFIEKRAEHLDTPVYVNHLRFFRAWNLSKGEIPYFAIPADQQEKSTKNINNIKINPSC